MLNRFGLARILWEGEGSGGAVGAPAAGTPAPASTQTPENAAIDDYEKWLDEQPKNVKDAILANEAKLRGALKDERDERQNLEKQVRTLSDKAEKGSDLQKELDGLANKIAESDARADFYELAHAAGITNLKLAYRVATDEGHIDKKGRVNFDALKAEYPELFAGKVKAPKNNAGDGSPDGQPPRSMNDWIRAQAGAKTKTAN